MSVSVPVGAYAPTNFLTRLAPTSTATPCTNNNRCCFVQSFTKFIILIPNQTPKYVFDASLYMITLPLTYTRNYFLIFDYTYAPFF